MKNQKGTQTRKRRVRRGKGRRVIRRYPRELAQIGESEACELEHGWPFEGDEKERWVF